MQGALARYELLSNYVKEQPMICIGQARAQLTQETLPAFLEKLERAEKIQREKVNVWLPILEEKRDCFEFIAEQLAFSMNNMSPKFKNYFMACKSKLAKFEWDEYGVLIRGKPIQVEVERINTEQLAIEWEKHLINTL